ncbi:MAG TPA: hypothetical protein VII76_08985 [Acidimicrobiales bacterium]
MEIFESPTQGLRVTGASTGERDIVEWITRHAQEEQVLLERYAHVAEHTTSPATRYLVDLIIEDERRHHRVLSQIAHAIAWGSINSKEPAVPRITDRNGGDGGDSEGDGDLIQAARALLASEKRDRVELRRLRRRLRSYSGTIWPLLIDLMLLDTDKHTRILRHVVRRHPR